jgi:hypothetical protein
MLIEIWEHLRGYDKWIQTEATIKSSQVEKVVRRKRKGQLIYGWNGMKEITWVDQAGARRTEMFEVRDNPLVFEKFEHKSVIVRYNPAAPSDFFVRELLRYQVNLAAKIALGALAAIAAIAILARS